LHANAKEVSAFDFFPDNPEPVEIQPPFEEQLGVDPLSPVDKHNLNLTVENA